MKKLLLLFIVFVSLQGFSQQQTLRGDYLFLDDVTIEGALTADDVGGETDTINKYVYMHIDSTILSLAFTDSSQFKIDMWLLARRNWSKDTIKITNCWASTFESGADFDYSFSTNDSSIHPGDPTDIWTTDITVNDAGGALGGGDEAGTPNNPYWLPGEYLLFQFKEATTPPPNGATINLEGHVQ